MTTTRLDGNSKVTLPIGIWHEGNLYREVEIDEMRGYDEQILTSKQAQANGAKGVTSILRRCILSIEGLFPRKKDLRSLVPEQFIRGMYVADRDFLLLSIRALALESDLTYKVVCPSCKTANQVTKPLTEFSVAEHVGSCPPSWSIPVNGFKRKLTIDGEDITSVLWEHPTGAVQEEITGKLNANGGSLSISSCCSVTIKGKTRKIASHEADAMPSRFRQFIVNEADKKTPGVDMHEDLICAACGNAWGHRIDESVFFSQSDSEREDV